MEESARKKEEQEKKKKDKEARENESKADQGLVYLLICFNHLCVFVWCVRNSFFFT